MAVTVTVDNGPSVQVDWTHGMNAQTALERAYSKINNSQRFTFGLQFFGQFGYLVTMFNETYDTFSNASAPYYYWEFFVNKHSMNRGIDSVLLNDGDRVSFSLELYVPEKHAGTTLAAKHKFRTTSKAG